ncbi:MAG: PASTA domain-containing protein [Acidimicrobiaceae bacterium]|nr:PASTA domain-containing protein [Acidimicrobiaceae bacterium]
MATTVVPTGLKGKSVTVACQAVVAAKLVCAQKDLGQAPAGQAPNVVTAVPKEGQTVAQQTSIEVDYYASGAPIKVPDFTKGEDPQTYCSKIPTGLICKPSDQGPGNPKGQVIKTEPAPGTPVPYGSTVLADYYSSSKPIFVPTPGAPLTGGGNVPTDPQGYCNFANNLGFNCTTQLATANNTNQVAGLADPGQPVNKVVSTNPAPSSTVGQPYGSDLTAMYFDKQGIAVPDETNQPKDTACSNITAAGLTCGTQTAASNPGQTPGTVIAGTEQPAAGLVVASGTTVNFSYDPGKTVPNVAGQDQPTACANIQAAGLTCSPVPVAGAYGTAPGVSSESPGAGTVVATNSTVTIDINNPAQPVIVGNCVGAAPGNCSTPGITYSYVDGGQFTVVNCNVVLSQDTAPGTPVAPGTTVTTHYNSCYTNSAPISEWHGTAPNMGKIHYLEFGTGYPNQPGQGWAGDGAGGAGSSVAGAYVPVNGTCPNGTVQLWQSTLPTTNGTGYLHYAYTPGGGWSSGGWSPTGVLACVFPASGGTCPVPIYSYTIDSTDWSWTPNPGGNGVQWCQLPS